MIPLALRHVEVLPLLLALIVFPVPGHGIYPVEARRGYQRIVDGGRLPAHDPFHREGGSAAADRGIHAPAHAHTRDGSLGPGCAGDGSARAQEHRPV